MALEVLILSWGAKTKLAERPKRLKVHIAEPGKKEKRKPLRIRVVEPSKKEEKRIMKLKAVELTQAEKDSRIKEVIETFWKKKGEASMDEIVSEAAKHGIDRRDVERFIDSEKSEAV